MLAYLLLRDNIQSGPYSLEELKAAGIRSTDMLWIEGRSSAWRYVDEIEELLAFVDADKMNWESISKSNNILHIHHEEDDGNMIRNGNQAGISSFLETGVDKGSGAETREENDKMAKDKMEERKAQEKVSRRSLEIRKNLLGRKEPALSSGNQLNGNNNAPSSPIRVIIADDHTLFREGVKTALSQKKDIRIVAEAENGAQLLHQLKHNRPDVVLLDIQMPVMDGISALVSIRKLYGNLKVIMLSMHDGHSMVSTLMETGANAYLTKTADPETIYQAIKSCHEKDFYFNELTNVSMLEELRKKKRITERTNSPSFDGAHLMKQLTAAQKRSARRSYRKTTKPILIGSLSVLLIASGTVAGLSLLNQPKQFKPKLPEINKKLPARSAASNNARAITFPQPTLVDSVQKKADETMNEQANNNLLVNDKKQIVFKHKQSKIADSFKTLPLQVAPNTDSILKANSAASERNGSSGTDDAKVLAKNNLRNLVTVSVNDYHKGLFGGLSDIQLKVNNRSAFTIDEVIVELQYMLAGSKLYKTENLNFQNIAPSSALILEAPKSTRGVKLEYRILSVRSKDLGL